ncbi:MAG: SRPBCC domain-containing protein [Terriglobia bacterium]
MNTKNQRSDKASRLISATADNVYNAFASATSVMQWLPPDGMIGRALEYDFTEGGYYRIELRYKDPTARGKSTSTSDVSTGRFIELVPNRLIKQSVVFESGDPVFSGEMVITWSFDTELNGTRAAVVAENVPTGITEADHQTGLNSSLSNLASFVELK